MGKDYAAAWVYNRATVNTPLAQTKETAGISGQLKLVGLQAGKYRATWWDTYAGKSLDATEDQRHQRQRGRGAGDPAGRARCGALRRPRGHAASGSLRNRKGRPAQGAVTAAAPPAPTAPGTSALPSTALTDGPAGRLRPAGRSRAKVAEIPAPS